MVTRTNNRLLTKTLKFANFLSKQKSTALKNAHKWLTSIKSVTERYSVWLQEQIMLQLVMLYHLFANDFGTRISAIVGMSSDV